MKSIPAILILAIALAIAGCSTPKETVTAPPPPPPTPVEPKPAVPEIFVRFASIDLGSVARKIEKPDIEKLAAIIKTQNIDILSVQGITRYPELKNRLDIFEEIAAATEMRKVWGENISHSGRQTGNAIFSTYPIRSHVTTEFEGITSANFESALQAVIDCGVRDVIVVSGRLPEKASATDVSKCLATIGKINKEFSGIPIVLSGNLPAGALPAGVTGFGVVPLANTATAPRIWYSDDGSLVSKRHNLEQTGLNTLSVSEFGIFRSSTR